MKKFLIALALALAISTAVIWASVSVSVTGCTADSKQATLTLGISEDASPAVVNGIKAAFTRVASSMPAAALVSPVGYQAFAGALTEEEKDAVEELTGPPVISGSCKRA